MAARRTPQRPKVDPVKRICNNCLYSEWITDDQRHTDLEGKPICLRCPYYGFYIVRGHKACNKWKPKVLENVSK